MTLNFTNVIESKNHVEAVLYEDLGPSKEINRGLVRDILERNKRIRELLCETDISEV
jgi:dihydroxyacetone kinase DhaKLM complex PTS-EIIA-like component DhaM